MYIRFPIHLFPFYKKGLFSFFIIIIVDVITSINIDRHHRLLFLDKANEK